MTQTPDNVGSNEMRERICNAAIDLFAAQGFNGASVRDLAQAVGVEAASLYYHFPSKQHLLMSLFERIMDDLLDNLKQAIVGNGSPTERLRSTIHSHVLFHINKRKAAQLSHSELRSLTPANRRKVVAKRDLYEGAVRALLQEGINAGQFHIDDVPVVATALLGMCSGVSDWIQPRGRLPADAVASLYAALALRLAGVRQD